MPMADGDLGFSGVFFSFQCPSLASLKAKNTFKYAD